MSSLGWPALVCTAVRPRSTCPVQEAGVRAKTTTYGETIESDGTSTAKETLVPYKDGGAWSVKISR